MLEIKNLSKTYGNGVRALDDVSLSIPKGMYGLLGPNGAGKSTLMRTLATLQAPDRGTATFGDIDIIRQPKALRATLGYLPQDFGVYPRMSARAMLDHLAVLKGITSGKERKRVVEGLLEQTNLKQHANKSVASYSGGMRQRFGIAQALLGDPQLIIVDEPTAGLDPEERNRFHNLLSEIGENVVVILSTHIVEDVADLCPLMAIMNQGKIVSQGAPGDLIAALEGKVWSKHVAKPDLPALRARLNVISERLVTGQVFVRVISDTDPGDGFEAATPDLEDVYFATIAQGRQAAAAA
ncbi:ABC transporter ATP-binding protein [Hyphobacterium sp. HN65]|uniref:ABC transporter ATP-binding protein n=1 Tax=Hyphobacterium lacteum TaxID=3116575 RepID=A0ABU7LPD2_9PROT|nr:ABC transporter ATP-binding protein [Hyphobacterium sp. HN65]MEE2525773.1 ABC transporter ATP-binding protein [Hyphobacterium sp. HN65]